MGQLPRVGDDPPRTAAGTSTHSSFLVNVPSVAALTTTKLSRKRLVYGRIGPALAPTEHHILTTKMNGSNLD
jgi:hypothetical protein